MKKRLYIISLISVFMVCFVVMAMRVKYIADNYDSKKNNKETTNTEETTTEYVNIIDVLGEIPEYDPGSIKDLKMKFEWSKFPEVEDYDIDNKVAKNGCYGRTTAEGNHRGLVYKEVYFYDKEHELSTELQGKGIYNKENIYSEGETFELKSECLNGEIKNIQLQKDINGYNQEYFFDINLVNEAINNNKVFITADIELRSTSNWVTESDIVPSLIYLSDEGEYLKVIENEKKEEVEQEISEKVRPVYYDLGFYDLNTEENCFLYPMRKGESVNFKVGYLVDVDKLDNAYLHYDIYDTGNINNSYNYIYEVLVKLKG